MTPLKLMDLARQACEPQSWYRLAKRLGTTQAQVATWRARGGTYDDEAACEIAVILGMDLEHVIAIRDAVHSKTEEKRRRWKRRLSRFAVLLLSAFGLYLFPSEDASASSPPSNYWNYSQQSGVEATENNARDFTFLQIMRRCLGSIQVAFGFGRFPACGS